MKKIIILNFMLNFILNLYKFFGSIYILELFELRSNADSLRREG